MRQKTEGLTKKQALVLDYIKRFQVEYKYPPSVRQICQNLTLSSPATVQSHINHLIEKGYLRRSKTGNRSIEILVNNEYDETHLEVRKIPLINPNTCNDIMKAFKTPRQFYSIPVELMDEENDYFAYVADDNDMSRLGINKNDIIIVQKSNAANDEDIVMVKCKKQIYVRKYTKEKREFILKNGNSEENIRLNKIVILGIVVGLYRKF